jgi:hypothetical protein
MENSSLYALCVQGIADDFQILSGDLIICSQHGVRVEISVN